MKDIGERLLIRHSKEAAAGGPAVVTVTISICSQPQQWECVIISEFGTTGLVLDL